MSHVHLLSAEPQYLEPLGPRHTSPHVVLLAVSTTLAVLTGLTFATANSRYAAVSTWTTAPSTLPRSLTVPPALQTRLQAASWTAGHPNPHSAFAGDMTSASAAASASSSSLNADSKAGPSLGFGATLAFVGGAIGGALATYFKTGSRTAMALQAMTDKTDTDLCEDGAPEELGVGEFYLQGCAQCMRAPDKKADGVRPEPWRGERYSNMDCGGWREQGIDPGIFANSLMEQVKAQDEKTDGQAPNPVVLMNNAYFQTLQEVEFGSSTCCIATLRPDGTLEIANLGDSGLMLIRGDQCVHRTEVQTFAFNAPLQLSTHGDPKDITLPQNSHQTIVQTQVGDIVVLATDGLLDNLYEDETVRLVAEAMEEGKSLAETAQKLKQVALELGQDRFYLSPFARGAQEAGYQYLGGKPDDITVVVARVAQK